MATLRRIRTIFTGVAGTPWYSNMYFEETPGGRDAQMALVAAFWTDLSTLIDNAVSWTTQAEVAVINDATGEIISVESGTPLSDTGGNSVEPLPYSNQALVNWNTGSFIGGRQLRGKTFIPGLTQTANDSGNLLAATRTTIQTAADSLVTDAGGDLRIFSPTNLTSQPVVGATASSIIAVLRSRRD